MAGNSNGRVELQKAKDELDGCTFVSPSTKGCYSSRIALWIHYCNEHCEGDDAVTGARLAAYVEWMVSSGAAERIRQDQTHIQQVLRNQLQGVICYWRIQNDDRADVADPRKSRVFMSKWHSIVQRYPHQRKSRRAEPIYGAQLLGADSDAAGRPGRPAGPTTAANWRPAIAGPSGGAGSRPIPPTIQQQSQYHHQQSLHRHRYPSTLNSATTNGSAPAAAPEQLVASLSSVVNGDPIEASNGHTYRSSLTPSRGSIPPQARAGSLSGHPLASSKFIVPQVPSLQSASNTATANSTAISRMSSVSLEYEDEARAENDERASAYQRAPGRPNALVPQQVPKHEVALHMPKNSLRGEFPSEMPVWDASVPKRPEGYLLVNEEIAALNLRQLEINNLQQSQARAYYNLGLASWLSVEQRSVLTLADIFMDETSTLAIQEQQLLLPLVQPASLLPATQKEEPARLAVNGSDEEKPISTSNSAPVSPDRDITDPTARKAESLPPLSSASLLQDSSAKDAPAASTTTDSPLASLILAATVSPARAMSVAIRSPNGTHCGMAQLLRHANPLFCTWSSLAIMFFRKWHVAKDPTPDFASSQWLSEKLFTEDFEMAFKVACKDISSDSLTGSEAMSDNGYFYADAFKLTHPSASGIKGLACVNAIDTEALLPEISIALVKANAGYTPTIKEPVKAPARFGVIPSQALQREIFPWIGPLMCAVLKQRSNSSEMLSVTRFLRMLKKLRMVLLQDIAFLLEVPLLIGSFQTHGTFNYKIFTSPEFLAYRAEMRQALGTTEIRDMDSYAVNTLRWIKERKQALPRGDLQRLKSTAACLLQPEFCPPPFSNNIIAANMILPNPTFANDVPSLAQAPPSVDLSESGMGLKRGHGLSHTQGLSDLHSAENNIKSDAPTLITKRARHEHEPAKIVLQTVQDEEGAMSVPVAEVKLAAAGEEQSLAHVVATIDELRMENDELRYRMRRIERTLIDQRTEVRSWMSKVEMALQGRVQALAHPRPVSPDLESAAQHYPGATARPGQPHLSPVHHRQSAYPSQASAQQQMYQARQQVRPPQLPSQQAQRAYADSRYQQSAVGAAAAHRQSSEAVAMHDGAGLYEGGMYGGGVSEAQAAAARRHFTLSRHKSGMQQQQAQAPMAHMGGHPGSAAQMQHVSYSRGAQHAQAQTSLDYSPHRAYADQRGAPQPRYSQAHANGADRADLSWHNGSQLQSAYSSRRASPGPHDGF